MRRYPHENGGIPGFLLMLRKRLNTAGNRPQYGFSYWRARIYDSIRKSAHSAHKKYFHAVQDRSKSGDTEVTFQGKHGPAGPKMTENVGRIIHAILFLITEATRRGLKLTQYDIVKSLFLADRKHLNEYGRPITFDNYVAMEHGPVPSLAYDFLKENKYMMRKFNLVELPWNRVAAPDMGAKCFYYSDPHFAPSGDVLSPSDAEALSDALTVVKTLGFSQIRRLTHEDPAYVDAWKGDGKNAQYPMKFSLLFDEPDEATTIDLSFFSDHLN